jgi:hypothetical protein
MKGPYTRYGPVAELLHEPECRYVVMSPGDEMTLEFDALPPPSSGKKRTYLFYGNGWLKDFDMNGGASDAVTPLPFDAMPGYPHHEKLPPKLEEFRKAYLTREADAEFWKLLR